MSVDEASGEDAVSFGTGLAWFFENITAIRMSTASPATTYPCACLGTTPSGRTRLSRRPGAFSEGGAACDSGRAVVCFSSAIMPPLLGLPLKVELALADFEVALIDHGGDDVGAVLQLEGDEVGLAVLQLVDGQLLGGRRLDVGELVIVIDGRDIEGRFAVIAVIELQPLRRILGAKLFYRCGGAGLCHLRLSAGCIHFAGGNQPPRTAGGGKRRRV